MAKICFCAAYVLNSAFKSLSCSSLTLFSIFQINITSSVLQSGFRTKILVNSVEWPLRAGHAAKTLPKLPQIAKILPRLPKIEMRGSAQRLKHLLATALTWISSLRFLGGKKQDTPLHKTVSAHALPLSVSE